MKSTLWVVLLFPYLNEILWLKIISDGVPSAHFLNNVRTNMKNRLRRDIGWPNDQEDKPPDLGSDTLVTFFLKTKSLTNSTKPLETDVKEVTRSGSLKTTSTRLAQKTFLDVLLNGDDSTINTLQSTQNLPETKSLTDSLTEKENTLSKTTLSFIGNGSSNQKINTFSDVKFKEETETFVSDIGLKKVTETTLSDITSGLMQERKTTFSDVGEQVNQPIVVNHLQNTTPMEQPKTVNTTEEPIVPNHTRSFPKPNAQRSSKGVRKEALNDVSISFRTNPDHTSLPEATSTEIDQDVPALERNGQFDGTAILGNYISLPEITSTNVDQDITFKGKSGIYVDKSILGTTRNFIPVIKKKKPTTMFDNRPSVIGLGTMGAFVLIAFCCCLIVLDSSALIRDAKMLKRRICGYCQPILEYRYTYNFAVSHRVSYSDTKM